LCIDFVDEVIGALHVNTKTKKNLPFHFLLLAIIVDDAIFSGAVSNSSSCDGNNVYPQELHEYRLNQFKINYPKRDLLDYFHYLPPVTSPKKRDCP